MGSPETILTDRDIFLKSIRDDSVPGSMTVIEIRPHRWDWRVFEAPGVEPVFPTKDDAIGYAQTRARFRTGEIRVLDSTGNVERVISFNEADRKL